MSAIRRRTSTSRSANARLDSYSWEGRAGFRDAESAGCSMSEESKSTPANESIVVRNKDLPAVQDMSLWTDMAYRLATEQTAEDEELVPALEWIVDKYAITKREALAVIAQPEFAEFLHNMTMAVARTEFDRTAFHRLIDIIQNGSHRNTIAASKHLAELLGYRKPAGVNVNINFEERLREAREKGDFVDAEILPGL